MLLVFILACITLTLILVSYYVSLKEKLDEAKRNARPCESCGHGYVRPEHGGVSTKCPKCGAED